MKTLDINNNYTQSSQNNFLTRPYLQKRPRRNRKSPSVRDLVQEVNLSRSDCVIPMFLIPGKGLKEAIKSMPQIYRFSKDLLIREIESWVKKGFHSFALFPVISSELKDETGSFCLQANNFIFETVKQLKQLFPQISLVLDIALDPFTSHSHDGLINTQGEILNDETLIVLGELASLYAQAGVDIVAPSDMMDGRVAYIREILDERGFQKVSILAYTAKYASSLYGPFRDALSSKPAFGDKKTYQMNPANVKEALLEASLDEDEGADFLMVKPAISYLDIISKLSQTSNLPIAAYHVSGEYAMVMAADQQGWLNKDQVLIEHLISIKRAGASFMFTYAYHELDKFLMT